jgi:hypothetical protein
MISHKGIYLHYMGEGVITNCFAIIAGILHLLQNCDDPHNEHWALLPFVTRQLKGGDSATNACEKRRALQILPTQYKVSFPVHKQSSLRSDIQRHG